MCKCTPEIRTPFCGKGECIWPHQKKPGQRDGEENEMSEETKLKPDWWPENPYPESIFRMTDDQFASAIPDENLRTSISGYCARLFFGIASREIFKAYKSNHEEAAELLISQCFTPKAAFLNMLRHWNLEQICEFYQMLSRRPETASVATPPDHELVPKGAMGALKRVASLLEDYRLNGNRSHQLRINDALVDADAILARHKASSQQEGKPHE